MTKSNPTEHTIKKGRRTKKREATDTEREIDLYCHSPLEPVPSSSSDPAEIINTPNSPVYEPIYSADSPSYHPPEKEILEMRVQALVALDWLSPRAPTFDETAPNVFQINLSPPALLFRGEAKEPAVARIQISSDEEFKVLCSDLMIPLLKSNPSIKDVIAKSASRYLEKTTGITGIRHDESDLCIREFPLLSGRPYDTSDHHNTTLSSHAVVIFDGIRVYTDRVSPVDYLSRFHYVMSRSVAEVERITQLMYGLVPY